MRRLLEGAVHAAVVAQAGFLDPLGAFLEPVPGVFFVLADVFFEDHAQKKLHRFEARFVHMRQRRQHGADFHIKRPEALVAIAHGGVDKSDFLAHAPSKKRSNRSSRSNRSKSYSERGTKLVKTG